MRAEARETPEGKLLVRYGFEPWDTESSARIVARKAAAEVSAYREALELCEHLLADMARYIVPGQPETPIEATLRVVREALKRGAP